MADPPARSKRASLRPCEWRGLNRVPTTAIISHEQGRLSIRIHKSLRVTLRWTLGLQIMSGQLRKCW